MPLHAEETFYRASCFYVVFPIYFKLFLVLVYLGSLLFVCFLPVNSNEKHTQKLFSYISR